MRAPSRHGALIMSNKITIVAGGRTVQARLRPWRDVDAAMNSGMMYWRAVDAAMNSGMMYWRGHKWNGHLAMRDEGIVWLRGWNHDKKTRDALMVSVALGTVD